MQDRLVVIPDGQSPVTLTAADHVATGGEGSVYAKENRIYKVYLSAEKAQQAGIDRKLPLLIAIQYPGIVSPQGALRDKAGRFIGIYMARSTGEPLCKFFTNGWRDLHKIGTGETARLSDSMRDIVLAAHAHRAVMVDANEMNWLVNRLTDAQVIDVDSWQIGAFPGTAIMPSIRDYSATSFTQASDWFAWATVTFQLWTGIHPYKGTHPSFPRGALQERMRAKASIFDGNVRLPAAARPVDEIPQRLRDWYERVFQGDERSGPPSAQASVIGPQAAPKLKTVRTHSGTVKQERMVGLPGPVRGVFAGVAVYEEGRQLKAYDVVRARAIDTVTDAELRLLAEGQAAIARAANIPLMIFMQAGTITARMLDEVGRPVSAPLSSHATRLWQAESRVFAVVEGVSNGLVELDASLLGDRLVVGVRTQWPVAALSSKLLDGVLVQDCIGMPFVAVVAGTGLVQGKAPGLREYRIFSGFSRDAGNVWLAGIRHKDGERVLLRLAGGASGFSVEEETLVDDVDLNAAVTSGGVGVLMQGDKLIVYKGANRKMVDSPGISGSMRLFPLELGVAGYDGGELVKLSLS